MTITVKLPDKLEAELKARVDAQKLELSEFVRQAIAEKLAREPVAAEPSAYEKYLEIYRGWSSGETDRAERAEEILRARSDAKRRGR